MKGKDKIIVVGNAFSVNMLHPCQWLICFAPATLGRVKEIIEGKEILSVVGHAGTAKIFSELLGVEIAHNPVEFKLDINKILIVGALGKRLPEGTVLTEEEVKNFPIQWWIIKML